MNRKLSVVQATASIPAICLHASSGSKTTNKYFGKYTVNVEQIVTGGAAIQHSPAWAQIISDALNKPFLVTDVKEISSRGVALLALRDIGLFEDLEAAPQVTGNLFSPDIKRYALYQGALERQQWLYKQLIGHNP